jgi:hypothetical protein
VLRRFLVWSALAALVGLVLAVGGYWAYWNFYARFQPVTISRGQAEIQQLLDEASWLSPGGGGEPVYVVTFRENGAGQRYEAEEFPKLRAAGAEPRVIVFARADREGLAQSTPAERATVAELWLSRDWDLYARWTATPVRDWTAAGVPAADGNLARTAVVLASREFVDQLGALLQDNGVPSGYPIVLWRDREGFLKACACADSRSWVFIRDDLGAPDAVREAVPPVETPEPGPADAGPPYPQLDQPLPDLPAEASPPPEGTTTAPAPPQARQDAETTFF